MKKILATFTLRPFYLLWNSSVAIGSEGWMGLQAGVNAFMARREIWPFWEWNLPIQPVLVRFICCALTARLCWVSEEKSPLDSSPVSWVRPSGLLWLTTNSDVNSWMKDPWRCLHLYTKLQCRTLFLKSRRLGSFPSEFMPDSWRQMAVAQWLRCCVTNRKVAGSIPAVNGFFSDIKSFRSHYGPGVDSTSNRNEYQEYFLGVKTADA